MNPVKVSVNSLTKNRAGLLKQALLSIERQAFSDYEVVVINDGSTDETGALLKDLKFKELTLVKSSPEGEVRSAEFNRVKIINHEKSLGITASRQEALLASKGEYVAILDDDDEWLDPEKLAKQVKYLDEHKDCVLVGGGIRLKIEDAGFEEDTHRFRPEGDAQIRSTMLFRNNFFTSTVMFRREAAIRAGGFIKDENDFAEDYDLWLRLGRIGQMHNFQEAFTLYRQPNYNKEKFKAFLSKQLRLIAKHGREYPGYWLARLILRIRINL